MISWVSVKARNDVTESNPHEETNSRYEYRIRCDYEANIKQLSHLIPTKNPQQWFETKLKFEEILENVNQLTNIEQKKQFTYLIMKNLSYMKEKEGNYQEAFIDAMKALSMSDLTDETALLVRIAYLSLKSNEIWTCQQLISSGHLSKALTPILSDLKEKCRIALLSQPPHPLKTLPSLIPPLLTLKIPIKSFDSVPENSSRLLSILKYFSELQASDIASYSTSGLLDLQYIDESNMVVVGPNVGDNRDISAKEVEFPQNSDNTKSVRKSARHIPRRLREISFDYASIQKGNTTDSMEQTSDFLNWDTLESSVLPLLSDGDGIPNDLLASLFTNSIDNDNGYLFNCPLPSQLIQSNSLWYKHSANESETSSNTTSERNSDSMNLTLIELFHIQDPVIWSEVNNVMNLSYTSPQEGHTTIDFFKVGILIFSALSVTAEMTIKNNLLKNIFEEFHTKSSELFVNLVSVCWMIIRSQYPRHSDLTQLFTQMKLSETILLGEILLKIYCKSRRLYENEYEITQLNRCVDCLNELLLYWERVGLYTEEPRQLPTNLSRDERIDDLLGIIRCYWVTILFLMEQKNNLNSQEILSRLVQRLIFLLNGHKIALNHIGSYSIFPTDSTLNCEFLKKFATQELFGIEKCYKELLDYFPTVLEAWKIRIGPLLDDILSHIQDDTENIVLSKLKLFDVYLPRSDPFLTWIRFIYKTTDTFVLSLGKWTPSSFLLSEKFTTRIKIEITSSPIALPLLLTFSFGLLGHLDMFILLANQLFVRATSSLRDILTTTEGTSSSTSSTSDAGDADDRIFQSTLQCSIIVRTLLAIKEQICGISPHHSEIRRLIRYLCHWMVYLGALRERFVLMENTFHDFISLSYVELLGLFSYFIQHSCSMDSTILIPSIVYAALSCLKVDLCLMFLVADQPSSPRSILKSHHLPCISLLGDILSSPHISSQVLYLSRIVFLFLSSHMRILDQYTANIRVLSDDSAIFLGPSKLSNNTTTTTRSLNWIDYLQSHSANHLIALKFHFQQLMIQTSLVDLQVNEDKEIWESSLQIIEKLYSNYSLNGLFLLDNGEYSLLLCYKFCNLLSYYYQHLDDPDTSTSSGTGSGTSISRTAGHSATRKDYFTSSLDDHNEQLLSSLMIIIGQILYDLYRFPLCQNYLVNSKSFTLDWKPNITIFPFMYLFIKFCTEFMGISNSLCRLSSHFLFHSLTHLRHPAAYHSPTAEFEMAILSHLTSTRLSSSSRILDGIHSDNIFDIPRNLLLSYYLDLIKYGLPENEFEMNLFPKRFPSYNSSSSSSIPSISFNDHYFFQIQEKDLKSYTYLNLCLTAITVEPRSIEMWIKMHERLLELIYSCLDDISYRIFPLQNLSSTLLEWNFDPSSTSTSGTTASTGSLLVQHLFLGTYPLVSHDLYNDLFNRIISFDTIQMMKKWNSSNYSSLVCENSACEEKNYVIPSHDGDAETDHPVDLTDSNYFLPLLIAKLNSLVMISTNIADVIRHLYCQYHEDDHSSTSDDHDEEAEDKNILMTRYLSLCESRSVLYFTLSKFSPTNSLQYSKFLKISLYYCMIGLDLISDPHIPEGNEFQFIENFEINQMNLDQSPRLLSSSHPSKYYFLYMIGKLLWKIAHRGDLALPYLYEAQTALTKILHGNEKIDKKLMALIVCAIHKIRFYTSMRVLWSLSNPTTPSYSPSTMQVIKGEDLLMILTNQGVVPIDKKIEESSSSQSDSLSYHSDPRGDQSSQTPIICHSCGRPKYLKGCDQLSLVFEYLMNGHQSSIQPIDLGDTSGVEREQTVQSFRMIAAESILGIASCRSWDPYDFHSVYLISKIYRGFAISRSYPELAWVHSSTIPIHPMVLLPSGKEILQESFLEIYKLFERKKVQIVSMWSHENSIHRLHQYIMYYWSLLLSTLSIKPANDLLTSIMISSNKFQCSASVYWLETIGILAYITLTRSLLHTLTPSTPTTYAVDVMKDFYCITESILLQKKMLFDVDLRHKCAELLIEIFRVVNPSLPSTSLSREKELSMAIEWCNSQGWSTISQAKRMRLSKGSRQETTPQPPLSADSPSSTTPSEQLVDSSGIESLSQTKKRPRGDGFFVPQTLDNEGTKKRRAVTRVKQLLNQIASMATSTPVSENIPVPPSPSPLTPPLPPQNPSSPRPPSTIRKIPIGKAKLVPPPYRVPDHIVQRNPGVLNKIPAPTVLRGGVKEKKRRAILKLRQIYYQERITGKIQLRSGDEEGEESGEVNERE